MPVGSGTLWMLGKKPTTPQQDEAQRVRLMEIFSEEPGSKNVYDQFKKTVFQGYLSTLAHIPSAEQRFFDWYDQRKKAREAEEYFQQNLRNTYQMARKGAE